jgi:hypothetical protein
MKKYIFLPLVIASLSMNIEMTQVVTENQKAEPIVQETQDNEQENSLTIYKSPDFISKWNDQFVESQSESSDK